MTRELHVTSPFMRGQDVLQVQEKLSALGYAPGRLDALYGPTTAAAVKDFQRRHQLQPTGIVDVETAAALLGAADSGNEPVRPSSEAGRAALTVALQRLGEKENPPGSNRTVFGEWYGVNGVPWCDIFVSYCFQIGARYTICDGYKGAGVRAGKGCAYVPTTEAWLKATGLWVGQTEPLPGDIAIFDWNGGLADHIGIVEQSLGGGRFITIEGNTGIGNDSNGGEVMRRERCARDVVGFGRV